MKAKITTLITIIIPFLFISKLHAQNPVLTWVKQRGATERNHSEGNAVITNTNGNVNSTGQFSETANFSSDPYTTNITDLCTSADIPIEKLDPIGNLLCNGQIGGRGYDVGTSIITDKKGNVYTTVSFSDAIEFNPRSGIKN